MNPPNVAQTRLKLVRARFGISGRADYALAAGFVLFFFLIILRQLSRWRASVRRNFVE